MVCFRSQWENFKTFLAAIWSLQKSLDFLFFGGWGTEFAVAYDPAFDVYTDMPAAMHNCQRNMPVAVSHLHKTHSRQKST